MCRSYVPRISVIMGVYNCKNKGQLFDSIKSIINQTFSDWELIICQDGFVEDTNNMLIEVEKLDERIHIIGYKENQGLAYALNECIKVAKGEIIARQDDDDVSLPDRLEKQIKFIDNNTEYDVVGTLAYMYDEAGVIGTFELPEVPKPKDFRWNSPFIHPTVMIRKESLIKVGGYRVSEETMRGQDYDLFMRMYGTGMRGYNIQDPLYKYKMVEGGYKKRPMKIRIGEMKIRWRGFKAMGILWNSLIYVVKPILLGLVPVKLLNKLR